MALCMALRTGPCGESARGLLLIGSSGPIGRGGAITHVAGPRVFTF